MVRPSSVSINSLFVATAISSSSGSSVSYNIFGLKSFFRMHILCKTNAAKVVLMQFSMLNSKSLLKILRHFVLRIPNAHSTTILALLCAALKFRCSADCGNLKGVMIVTGVVLHGYPMRLILFKTNIYLYVYFSTYLYLQVNNILAMDKLGN